MTKQRAWPVRAMYLLVAAALVMSLMIMAVPSQTVTAASGDVKAEWDDVTTPSMQGWVLAPESTIIDYALAADGEVAYAIVEGQNVEEEMYYEWGYWLLRSTDHGATWRDITEALEDVINIDDGDYIDELLQVATDWVDPDFVAVALWWWDVSAGEYFLDVFISSDGGATFDDVGEVEDGGLYLYEVADLAVSYEDDGERDIAIGGLAESWNGTNWVDMCGLFRSTVVGDSASGWEDATDFGDYEGWDNQNDDDPDNNIYSDFVIDILFAPSWAADRTILVLTVEVESWMDGIAYGHFYLQSGTWGQTEGWNAKSILGIDAVLIKEYVYLPYFVAYEDYRGIGGILAPSDYSGRNTDGRYAWVWMNYYDDDGYSVGEILRVKNTAVVAINQQIEDMPWLTNVSYWGTIASGKAIAGVLGTGTIHAEDAPWELFTYPCEGVQVYRNDGIDNMDICCIFWEEACKPPTGIAAMAVSYVSADKAYAVALQGFEYYDEGAWSVSWDDGDIWNQLSLIDTYISLLTDVAVSPDCNKTMLVSINYGPCWQGGEPNGDGDYCDSVWLHAENLPEDPDYSGQWLRTWCGKLTGQRECDYPFGMGVKWGLLRLAPEETDGMTVYLVDVGTDTVYWSEMETLDCWKIGTSTVERIADLAVKDRETIYALDYNGDVAMSDDFAIGWYPEEESTIDDGWTIAVWGDDILVGGQYGEVSHSADGGETFAELEDLDIDGYITVAFDSYFDTNSIIYAAVAAYEYYYYDYYNDWSETLGGIFRWTLDESESWYDLGADNELAYTGLVLDNADGNPMTSADTGGVLYASYIYLYEDYYYYDRYGWTGAARYLTPGEDVICKECDEWDYLEQGLHEGWHEQYFIMMPRALKICGCLTPDTYTKIFAIGFEEPNFERERCDFFYDMVKAEYGTVWMFEDCYGKGAPDLRDPADGDVIPADPCDCQAMPFALEWDRLCDACKYQIQIALDSDFTEGVRYLCPDDYYYELGNGPNGYDNCWITPLPAGSPSYLVFDEARSLVPGQTYYWRVRAIEAETEQQIRSWWSLPQSFTVALAAGTGVVLVTPEDGGTDVPRANTAFTWTSMMEADSYNWVLSPNADMSGPVESRTGLTATAWTTNATLAYNTPYFWQVTSIKDGAATSMARASFTTAAAPQYCSPASGLCFDTEAELRAHHEELQQQQMVTPVWVWVVIALGAVLVIVVIVLIFRTRRV